MRGNETHDRRLKRRLLVLTDISSTTAGFKEPDDAQSLIRLLVYANHFDIEGLIATHTSHWDDCKPQYIRDVIRAYGSVHGELIRHDAGFPAPEYLNGVVRSGNPLDGLEHIGEGKDTEGSDWIIEAGDREDARPLWITIWGGTTDLAQALWRVRDKRARAEVQRFISRLRIYSIGDQYQIRGWVREHFPDLFYITCNKAMRGMYKGGDESLVHSQWLHQHVMHGHGSLGERYPDYDGGDTWGGGVQGVKEGDSPSFMYLLPQGPGDPDHPELGSWGGRFIPNERLSPSRMHFFDACDRPEMTAALMASYDRKRSLDAGTRSAWESVSRWRAAYQASFQSRMDWCVKPFCEANHEPVAVIQGVTQGDGRLVEMDADSAAVMRFDASGSWDPDGDELDFTWSLLTLEDSVKPLPDMAGADTPILTLKAPVVSSPRDIHLLLTVTDRGDPPLSSYCRLKIRVQ